MVHLGILNGTQKGQLDFMSVYFDSFFWPFILIYNIFKFFYHKSSSILRLIPTPSNVARWIYTYERTRKLFMKVREPKEAGVYDYRETSGKYVGDTLNVIYHITHLV